MSRGPCTFKQRDVTQAVKGVIAAGMRVARCEIDRQGKIILIAAEDDAFREPTVAEGLGPTKRIVL